MDRVCSSCTILLTGGLKAGRNRVSSQIALSNNQTLLELSPVSGHSVSRRVKFLGACLMAGQTAGLPERSGIRKQGRKEQQKGEGQKQPLAAAGLHALRDEYTRTIEPARALAAETLTLERTLSDLVNQAYALTPAEIDLMWQTAPPRMPISPPAASKHLPRKPV